MNGRKDVNEEVQMNHKNRPAKSGTIYFKKFKVILFVARLHLYKITNKKFKNHEISLQTDNIWNTCRRCNILFRHFYFKIPVILFIDRRRHSLLCLEKMEPLSLL